MPRHWGRTKVLSRAVFAGPSQGSLQNAADSSEEEGAHRPLDTLPAVPVLRGIAQVSVATQTTGSVMDHVHALAERSSLGIIHLNPIREQFWASILSCLKMPRGGVNAGGSMHCTFEFVAASEAVVKHVMEDLPLLRNRRYNASRMADDPTADPWEDSPSINTYSAMDSSLIDSYFRLHRRKAAKSYRAYRGSVLANPPDTHPDPVCVLSACPPFLVELCHRKHQKLVLAVSFNVSVFNDQGLLTLPPAMPYSLGMDVVQERRVRNSLKKMHSRNLPMSAAFKILATSWDGVAPDSDGEWVPPPSDLTLLGLPPRGLMEIESDSGAEADTEEDAALMAAADTKRPRGEGTHWSGRMRYQ